MNTPWTDSDYWFTDWLIDWLIESFLILSVCLPLSVCMSLSFSVSVSVSLCLSLSVSLSLSLSLSLSPSHSLYHPLIFFSLSLFSHPPFLINFYLKEAVAQWGSVLDCRSTFPAIDPALKCNQPLLSPILNSFIVRNSGLKHHPFIYSPQCTSHAHRYINIGLLPITNRFSTVTSLTHISAAHSNCYSIKYYAYAKS